MNGSMDGCLPLFSFFLSLYDSMYSDDSFLFSKTLVDHTKACNLELCAPTVKLSFNKNV